MAKVLVTETYLEDIGDAIRSVNGLETTYKPSEMAAVIDDFYIEPTGTKSITANGTGIDVKDYASADVNVPNSYSASDEGKVVDGGELVAQGSLTITENDTYDTTLKNEVVVNVSGGGSGALMYIDYTKMSVPYTLTNVLIDSSGAHFDSTSDRLQMPFGRDGMSVEVDVATMQLTAGSHRRFVMVDHSNGYGFIFRSTGTWAFYSGTWEDATFSGHDDGSYFENSTVKVTVDENGFWNVYKDGVLIFSPINSRSITATSGVFYIGSTSNSINNALITGIRIY